MCYDSRLYGDGSDYSRMIMKGFLNSFQYHKDGMFYLIKGLEMLYHELDKEYANAVERNHGEEDWAEEHMLKRLDAAIADLKGRA